jgi:ribosomal protein S18 acetylase RimI-like enzyme
MIDLVLATEQDRDFAFEAKKQGLKEYVDQMSTWDESEEVLKHNARFEKYDFWTINYIDQKVGVISYEVYGNTLKLNQIYVLPEFQSQGIGAHCITHLQRLAKSDDLVVSLQVLFVNERAKQFYQTMGFIEVARSHTHYQMESHEIISNRSSI